MKLQLVLKPHLVWATVMLLLAGAVHADIYKCTINGVVSYSDSKCGPQAEKVEIIPEEPDVENGAALQRQAEQINSTVSNKAASGSVSRGGHHDRKIAALEQESAELRAQMEAEVKPLQVRRDRANRYSSLQNSLDAQIRAITRKYEAKIKENQELIDGLRARQ